METLKIPDSDVELHDGSVISFIESSDKKWILHHGNYIQDCQSYCGWYLCSIPDGAVIPADTDILKDIIVVDNSVGFTNMCCPAPDLYPPGQCPPGPSLNHRIVPAVPKELVHNIDAAFLTVGNLEERDALSTERFPDGKLICVNDVDGERKYYIWDKPTSTWFEVSLEIDTSQFLTLDVATSTFTTPEQVREIVEESTIGDITDIIEQTTSPRFETIENYFADLEARVENHENNTYTKYEIDALLDWGSPLI